MTIPDLALVWRIKSFDLVKGTVGGQSVKRLSLYTIVGVLVNRIEAGLDVLHGYPHKSLRKGWFFVYLDLVLGLWYPCRCQVDRPQDIMPVR